MSIRFRLVIICVFVTILPAMPLTLLVRNLLEKSFNVGLSTTVSDALDSGMLVSRKLMIRIESDFEEDVQKITTSVPSRHPDSSQVKGELEKLAQAHQVDGYLVASQNQADHDESAVHTLPSALRAFADQPEFRNLLESRSVAVRPPHLPAPKDLSFYETKDKAVQLALWAPSGASANSFLFYRKTDPDFVASARQLVNGRQIFAQLRLAQGALSQSFFYPFIIVYGVLLVLALLLALLMAERMAAPLRRLTEAAVAVAGGNWRIQLRRETGGEIGRLIDSFNLMVSRLDSQRRRLLDMEKVVGWREMARHLAHEIKNPLLPIRLAVQEMRDQYRGDDDSYRDFVGESARVVEDELGHLQRLVKEFSAFATMPGLSPTRGSLEHLVSDLTKLYPGVETHVEVDPALPEFPFDNDQLRRMFVNLFDNSRSASRDVNETKISIEMKRRSDDAIIVFSDNGPGIPAANLPRIFDPYFTTRRTGTGLGLALVKSIVLMHRGTIEVDSPAGRGAVFTITLPLKGPGKPDSDTGTNQEER